MPLALAGGLELGTPTPYLPDPVHLPTSLRFALISSMPLALAGGLEH